MARMPGTTYRPLGSNPQVEGLLTDYDILCLHTMVGSLWGTDSYFRQSGYSGVESHFGVGYDGETLQWQDTRYRADANLDGVDRVISIETADMGTGFPAWGGSNVPAWTPRQIEANAQIAAWAHRTHGIPLVLIPNTAQSSRGVGYHRQGIEPWKCAACEQWGSRGKVCPGDRRVAQMPQVITRARQIVAGEDDMATPQEIAAAVWATPHADPRAPADEAAINMKVLLDRMRKDTAAAAQPVDMAALAAGLAPLLIPHLPTVVVDLDAETLAAIAVAVADEQARRQQE